MGKSVVQKLIASHRISGTPRIGEEIALKTDQTLTQGATGTMVTLELEAMHNLTKKERYSVEHRLSSRQSLLHI